MTKFTDTGQLLKPEDGARTSRGFRTFARFMGRDGNVVVRESSLAFEGAHVRVHGETNESVHLSVAGVKELVTALTAFITDAEAGKLMEEA
jgi:hypothetical protein